MYCQFSRTASDSTNLISHSTQDDITDYHSLSFNNHFLGSALIIFNENFGPRRTAITYEYDFYDFNTIPKTQDNNTPASLKRPKAFRDARLIFFTQVAQWATFAHAVPHGRVPISLFLHHQQANERTNERANERYTLQREGFENVSGNA